MTELIVENGTVVGVKYVKADGTINEAYGPVVICTGGYAADFSPNSLLQKWRSDLAHLPTTNGDHCTGDGIKFAVEQGAGTIDME